MKWLTTREVAHRAECDVTTVTRAAVTGSLHGHQRLDGTGRPVAGSRWKFHPAAVDAWVQGADQHGQAGACGCPRLRAVAS